MMNENCHCGAVKFSYASVPVQFVATSLQCCRICACTTHWLRGRAWVPQNMAVNMALCDPAAIRQIPVRRFDGADTWTFLD